MLVDFYQLGEAGAERVIASIAGKLIAEQARLIIVDQDPARLARLDRLLWDQGRSSFLPHARSGEGDDTRQPILLSDTPDAPNLARNILIADGSWREAALNFDRAFFLFGPAELEAARLAWKLLAGREGVERRYWAQDPTGAWEQKG